MATSKIVEKTSDAQMPAEEITAPGAGASVEAEQDICTNQSEGLSKERSKTGASSSLSPIHNLDTDLATWDIQNDSPQQADVSTPVQGGRRISFFNRVLLSPLEWSSEEADEAFVEDEEKGGGNEDTVLDVSKPQQ